MNRILILRYHLGIALIAMAITQFSPRTAWGEDKVAAGPPAPKDVEVLDEHGLTGNSGDSNSKRVPEHILNQRLQLAGHIALGTGFGAVLVGITLIEVDSWGDIGKAGFISACAGTGVAIVGMFLLGFSHPVHTKKKERRRLSQLRSNFSG